MCGHLDIQHDSLGCYECEFKHMGERQDVINILYSHKFNIDYKNPLNNDYQKPVFDYTYLRKPNQKSSESED